MSPPSPTDPAPAQQPQAPSPARPEPAAPAPEPDVIPLLRLMWVVVGLLVAGLLAVAWSWNVGTNRLPTAQLAPASLPGQVSGVRLDLIGPASGARERADRQRTRLAGYGWIPGEPGVAHVPIDDAMAAWVTREAREKP